MKGQLTDIIFHHIVQFSFDQSYDIWVNLGEVLPGLKISKKFMKWTLVAKKIMIT